MRPTAYSPGALPSLRNADSEQAANLFALRFAELSTADQMLCISGLKREDLESRIQFFSEPMRKKLWDLFEMSAFASKTD